MITVHEELTKLHADLKEVHGELWPDHWWDWFLQWRDRLTLRQQAVEVGRLYGRVYPHTTIRNLHLWIDDNTHQQAA